MSFSLSQIKNLRFKKGLTALPHWERDDIVFGGVMALAFFFLLVLLTDGYFFYQTVLNKKELTPAVKKVSTLTAVDIEDAIKLLDLRQKKFEDVLAR